jgi:hypothetical protein
MIMGGWGHTAGIAGAGVTGHVPSHQTIAPFQRSEASSGNLTITLSFPTPTGGSVVTVSAVLRSDGHDRDPADGEIWLPVERPDGRVDQLPMQRYQSATGAIYQAPYGFPTSGLYVVTADARAGTGTDARTVSVTTRAEVVAAAPGERHDWLIPAAVLGSLGMVAMMVFMTGGSTS